MSRTKRSKLSKALHGTLARDSQGNLGVIAHGVPFCHGVTVIGILSDISSDRIPVSSISCATRVLSAINGVESPCKGVEYKRWKIDGQKVGQFTQFADFFTTREHNEYYVRCSEKESRAIQELVHEVECSVAQPLPPPFQNMIKGILEDVPNHIWTVSVDEVSNGWTSTVRSNREDIADVTEEDSTKREDVPDEDSVKRVMVAQGETMVSLYNKITEICPLLNISSPGKVPDVLLEFLGLEGTYARELRSLQEREQGLVGLISSLESSLLSYKSIDNQMEFAEKEKECCEAKLCVVREETNRIKELLASF